jgi:hypothetical protein
MTTLEFTLACLAFLFFVLYRCESSAREYERRNAERKLARELTAERAACNWRDGRVRRDAGRGRVVVYTKDLMI